MAHVPLNPDEVVPPHMHGFDPLPKNDAINLISGFTPPASGIKNPSFYLDAATLTALMQGERNRCTYDGFHIMFGLDEYNELLLLIHRVKVRQNEIDCGPYEYDPIPQRVAVEIPETNEIDVIDFAIKPTNKDGLAQLYRIKRGGDKYNAYRKHYQDVFYGTETDSQASYSPQRNQFAANLVTGYFIGWGILDLIRKELNSKVGIKFFLGYGNLSLTISSVTCMHLVVIAADNPNATLDDYSLPLVWSTQDQTKREIYILDDDASNSPVSLASLRHLHVGTLGTSCTFALRDTV